MNYVDALNFLDRHINTGCKPGLERVSRLLDMLLNPHKKLKVVHVGGTNGKGSVCAMISNILKCSDYKVGLYTSPHLNSIRERMKINDEMISEEDFVFYFNQVWDKINIIKKQGQDEPTQFEVLTAMAFLYFADKNVDIAVFEVGLGGRFDATNICNSILSVITSISYDHMDILGNSIEEIAFEKAGIIKEDSSLVLYPQKYHQVDIVIQDTCDKKNCILYKIDKKNLALVSSTHKAQIFDFYDYNIENIELNMIGEHQLYNAATAITAIKVLCTMGFKIDNTSIRNGLKTVNWPLRLSIVSERPLILIDGAHNIDGIIEFNNALHTYFSDYKKIVICGMLKDKDYKNAAFELSKESDIIITTTPNSDRSLLAEELAKEFKKHKQEVICEEKIENAIKIGLELCTDNKTMLCICGSLYLVGTAHSILMQEL